MNPSTACDLLMCPAHVTDDVGAICLDCGPDPEPAERTVGVSGTLGISHPMVNYSLGNQDGRIAEAGRATYVRYVMKLLAAVETAPARPSTVSTRGCRPTSA